MNELSTSLVSQINSAHEATFIAVEGMREKLISAVNSARECGIFLVKLKEETRHGEWEALFRTAQGKENTKPVLFFDSETARIYMRLSKALPNQVTELADGIRTLTDVLLATGALAPRHREEKQLASGLGVVGQFAAAFGRAWQIIGKAKDALPVESWPKQRRDALKEQLRPAHELYQQL